MRDDERNEDAQTLAPADESQTSHLPQEDEDKENNEQEENIQEEPEKTDVEERDDDAMDVENGNNDNDQKSQDLKSLRLAKEQKKNAKGNKEDIEKENEEAEATKESPDNESEVASGVHDGRISNPTTLTDEDQHLSEMENSLALLSGKTIKIHMQLGKLTTSCLCS